MLTKRKRRIFLISSILLSVSIAVGLSLYALGQSIDLYLTPRQVWQQHIVTGREFRLGGMVVAGSVQHIPNTLIVNFVLTDYNRKIRVTYNGILPALFHEGQGIVAQGSLNSSGIFVANQVLAKHDENYHPPKL